MMTADAKKHVALSNAQTILDSTDREFDFSSHDFQRVRKLIYDRAGISLNETKQSMVYSRLARRLRALGIERFSQYLDSLEKNVNLPEWEEFVNALTTNLTSFFREAHHFPILATHLKKMYEKHGSLNIWCSAASTGEEPYTLAITACEAFGSMTPPVKILASDIDTKVLATAREGVYREESVEKMDPSLLKKYFLKGTGEQAGSVRVRSELKNLLTFRQLNLLDPQWQMRGGFSAIFCRNVMIYFDKPTQHKILERFAPLLLPQGLLFVGHSENFTQMQQIFQLKGKTVYEVQAAAAGAVSQTVRSIIKT